MAAAIQNALPCCQEKPVETPISDKLFYLLEKVTAAALGVFCAYTSMELFIPFFALGIGVSVYERLYGNSRNTCGNNISCSQGFMEQLTGVRLPPLFSMSANLAVTWCHIQHHTSVFVPIIGLSMGAWAGKSITQIAHG